MLQTGTMAKFNIAGIDPGFGGACAIYRIEVDDSFKRIRDRVASLIDMPLCELGERRLVDGAALNAWLVEHKPDHVIVEQVNAMPSIPGADGERRSMGAASAFKFGHSFGVIEGVVMASGLDNSRVVPRVWKARAGLSGPNKEDSRQLALRRMPNAGPFLTRKMDEGRAEALLLAIFGAERFLNDLRQREFNKGLFDNLEPKAQAG